jgi:O-antigen/teichoic acid export membrane protein
MSRAAGSSVKPRSLKEKFARNFIGFGYSQVVTLAVQFLTVPFFLRYWGSEKYADWLVLSGLPATLILLDFGVTTASASKANMRAARQDSCGVVETLQTALAFSLVVSLAILLTTVAAALWVDIPGLLRVDSLPGAQVRGVLILLAAHVCVTMLGGVLDAWFQAMDKASVGYFLLANRRLVDVVVCIAVLAAGGSAVVLAAGMLGAQVLWFAGITAFAKSRSPWAVVGITRASGAEFRDILRPAAAHVGMTIGQIITLQGSVQVLNQIAPAPVVVLYSMCRTLMRVTMQIGGVTNVALRPELARLLGSDQLVRARSAAVKAAIVAFGAGIVAYGILVAAGPALVSWWSVGAVMASAAVLAAIGLHTVFNLAWSVLANYFIAGNRHSSLSMVYLAGCIVGMALWLCSLDLMAPLAGCAVVLAVPELFGIMYIAARGWSMRSRLRVS